MMKKSIIFVLLSLLLLAAGRQPLAQAAPGLQGNILANPGFEAPYDDGVADGWTLWFEESDADAIPEECTEPYFLPPTARVETESALVAQGAASQFVGNEADPWHGGVMQTVAATPGARYRFTFLATGRASDEAYPAPSDTAVSMGVRAGIDPDGSGSWSDGDVVWSEPASPHMAGGDASWQTITVEATATGEQITVYGQANFGGAGNCRANLHLWIDDAELSVAQPAPTATPLPTPAGTICVNAFADPDGDGLHEEAEGAMAGVTFTVVDDEGEIRQGISSGPEPVCFRELPTGSYQVAQSVPATLEMTTGANIDVTLGEGETVMVDFGSRLRPEPQDITVDDTVSSETIAIDDDDVVATGGVAPADEAEGFSLLAVSGLAAIFLAVTMFVVLLFLLLRRRRGG